MRGVLLSVGFLMLSGAVVLPAEENPIRPPVGFIKGMTWGWLGQRGEYEGEAPDHSLRCVAELGATWVSIAFAAHMKAVDDTHIAWGKNDNRMVTDEEIKNAIQLSRKHHLKTLLKPCVETLDGKWRAMIHFKTKEDWDAWFANYDKFIVHYARIAEEEKCEMFCVGCEMMSMESHTEECRQMVKEVRNVYHGYVVYNSEAEPEKIKKVEWWDAVDIIGASEYFAAGRKDSSLKGLLDAWETRKEKLKEVSQKFNKPILFMEIGVPSVHGGSASPGDWKKDTDLPYDADEQARYYRAVLETFWNEGPWFAGFCWWCDWPSHLRSREKEMEGKGYGIYGKPAEEVLREWYGKRK